MVERNSGQFFGDEGRTSSFVCFVFFLLRSNEMLVHREREMTNRCIIIIIIKVEGNIDRARFERNFNKKKIRKNIFWIQNQYCNFSFVYINR